jgi:hypothetical protein
MFKVGTLNRHSSSKRNLIDNIDELATRIDLGTPDDFYFGFASSNYSFFDIINNKAPLALKVGNTLSLYQKGTDGQSLKIYLIDKSESPALHEVIQLIASPRGTSEFNRSNPFDFNDSYLRRTKQEIEGTTKHEESTLYDMARRFLCDVLDSKLIDSEQLEKMSSAAKEISDNSDNISLSINEKLLSSLLQPLTGSTATPCI